MTGPGGEGAARAGGSFPNPLFPVEKTLHRRIVFSGPIHHNGPTRQFGTHDRTNNETLRRNAP